MVGKPQMHSRSTVLMSGLTPGSSRGVAEFVRHVALTEQRAGGPVKEGAFRRTGANAARSVAGVCVADLFGP